MTKTATTILATAAAALSAAASADAGFVYASSLRSISLTSPSGTAGASSSAFGDFLEFRSFSAPAVSGALQQASTLGADSMSFGAFAQLFSNAAGFGGPLSGFSLSSVIFAVDADLLATLSVGTTLQSVGASSSTGMSVVLRDVLTGVVIYSTNTNATDTLEYTFVAGRNYQLDVTSAASIASGTGNAFTNYSVSITAVPAPATIAMVGLAALGRRRRR
jgi:MYXO-CTERM domain-containing protein